jgi:hypothetical protein
MVSSKVQSSYFRLAVAGIHLVVFTSTRVISFGSY